MFLSLSASGPSYIKSESVSSSILCHPMDYIQPTRLFYLWNSSGKNTEVDCHSLLQGSIPTQGSNPGLFHCRQILYLLSHQGSPPSYDFPINLPRGQLIWSSHSRVPKQNKSSPFSLTFEVLHEKSETSSAMSTSS